MAAMALQRRHSKSGGRASPDVHTWPNVKASKMALTMYVSA